MHERFYPSEEHLGRDCQFWQGLTRAGTQELGGVIIGCAFPKYEMEGRLSCEGIIDDVCLFLMIGRPPRSLTQAQIEKIRHRNPGANNRDLPPGDIR